MSDDEERKQKMIVIDNNIDVIVKLNRTKNSACWTQLNWQNVGIE